MKSTIRLISYARLAASAFRSQLIHVVVSDHVLHALTCHARAFVLDRSFLVRRPRDVSHAQYQCTTASVIDAGVSLDIKCSLTVRLSDPHFVTLWLRARYLLANFTPSHSSIRFSLGTHFDVLVTKSNFLKQTDNIHLLKPLSQ